MALTNPPLNPPALACLFWIVFVNAQLDKNVKGIVSIPGQGPAPGRPSDKEMSALYSFFLAMGKTAPKLLVDWNFKKTNGRYVSNPCNPSAKWTGISCIVKKGKTFVSDIDLSQLGLVGKIPKTISDLQELMLLDLSSNNLSGTLPSSIGLMSNMLWLSLQFNSLSGTIPTYLNKLKNLQELELWGNSFTGNMPSLGSLKNLRVLDVSDNKLSGSFPADIVEMESLTTVSMYQNGLVGEIPPGIGRLTDLEVFDVAENKMSGTLPEGLLKLEVLDTLGVNSNTFTGRILDFGELCGLRTLDLGDNKFTGELPSGLSGAKALQYLSVAGNSLDGSIPSSFYALKRVQNLLINNNPKLSGGNIPKYVCTWKHLTELEISDTGFDCIPKCLEGRLSLSSTNPVKTCEPDVNAPGNNKGLGSSQNSAGKTETYGYGSDTASYAAA